MTNKKKKRNGQQNTLRDIRPSLIRQNKPPPLLSAQDLCFLFLFSLQRRAAYFIYTTRIGSRGRPPRVLTTKFERLNFDAIGTKVEPCALFLAPFGTSKRDPLLHLYVSTGWDFFNPGVSCLPVYIYIGAVQSHGTTVFLSLRCCASPSPGTTPLPVWVFDHCPTFLNCQVLFRFGFFFLSTALCLPSP